MQQKSIDLFSCCYFESSSCQSACRSEVCQHIKNLKKRLENKKNVKKRKNVTKIKKT